MTELEKIFLTAALTIVGGFVVFMSGQIALRFVLEPVYELRRTGGEVGDILIRYSDLYRTSASSQLSSLTNLNRIAQEARKEAASAALKGVATALSVKVETVPWYGVFDRFKAVPPKDDVVKACQYLIQLSDLIKADNASGRPACVYEIIKALRLPQQLYRISQS